MKDAKREIIGLALLLEDISDLTVFVDYAGHVKRVDVRVVEDYDGKRNVLLDEDFYTDLKYTEDKTKVKTIKSFLQSKIDEYTAIGEF